MVLHGNDVFPTLQSCTRLATDQTLFDVQFWPFGTNDDDQIFAVTGATDTIICRPQLRSSPPFEVLRWFRDESEQVIKLVHTCTRGDGHITKVAQDNASASLNSLAWTQDPVTQKPWICVAGDEHKHIKILDIESGYVARVLSGHGGAINDLCVSPISTSLLASCANDSTIRLWNLEPSHQEQPCVALLAGEGHKAPILAIEFHPNGKWLLSGGIDTAVCLWAVPDAAALERNDHSPAAKPLIVYYPHFYTEELHPNYVDCFGWYGDLIISKAARDQVDASKDIYSNEILLWKIEGFDADEPPAEDPPIPEAGYSTRSSFPHDEDFRGFARLLTMNIPHTDRFYHRFGLLHADGMRPILCMGDQETRFSFWDLQRFEEGIDPLDRPSNKPRKKGGRKKKGPNVLGELRRSESIASGSSPNQTPDASSTIASSTTGPEGREYTLSDRFTPLAPHYSVTANTDLTRINGKERHFATSQIAWSPDGTWMVTVGDMGMICMFHRDKSVV
ncbi:Putative polycomb protein EED [Septoria linicola]|uniref:Polycomb protein EED n=1 Tax=Septoria linicola TaxID=215465 RepID=A0A9Q9ELD4_9PEZI|nr:Putative polycomb protein EED [Septoria linicola]